MGIIDLFPMHAAATNIAGQQKVDQSKLESLTGAFIVPRITFQAPRAKAEIKTAIRSG
jgi:hypothetical protein